MKYLALVLLLQGCGMDQRVKGGTKNEVIADGKVDVNIVLKIDLSQCDEFGTAAKLDCIEAITGAFDSIGDLSKVLVCPPDQTKNCDLLSKILDGVK
jgi:hypothetical protein